MIPGITYGPLNGDVESTLDQTDIDETSETKDDSDDNFWENIKSMIINGYTSGQNLMNE
eukprot:CAMPEP_0116871954 /NCGR_PEP_ID=MMETSP0463-20121206/2529_1 /TAXON_ID=181622 /ORGANISM="Strombidinopsis sp, Strain SopsisLIS2011" /LENGTH=58 /DNA_ID=CAMNT_0004511341 /DNA_START=727 /DNA_END=903 /DNA_ORIENTATION=+